MNMQQWEQTGRDQMARGAAPKRMPLHHAFFITTVVASLMLLGGLGILYLLIRFIKWAWQ